MSPDSLTHLTTFTLCSLRIGQHSSFWGSCRRNSLFIGGGGGAQSSTSVRRNVHSSASRRGNPGLLPAYRVVRAAENWVLTEVAGHFRPESDFDDGTTEKPTPSDPNITGVLRAFYLASMESTPIGDFIDPYYSVADRKARHTRIRGAEFNIKSEGRKINRLRFDALVQLLHSQGRLSEASWLRSNRFQRSVCWLAGPPGGFLAYSIYFPLLG